MNYLPGELYLIEANEKNSTLLKMSVGNNSGCSKSKSNKGGSAKLLQIKIGAKVMLTSNLDTQDCLINGQTGNIQQIQFVQGSV